MQTKQTQSDKRRSMPMLTILLALALMMIACNASVPNLNSAISTAEKVVATAAERTPSADANATPVGQSSSIDCQAVAKANMEFGTNLAQMVNFTADTDYAAYSDPASPLYIDFPKVKADLAVFATLPDPTDPADALMGKPSDAVAYFSEMVDIAMADVESKGKPFNDTNANGQKVFGLDSAWMKEMVVFGPAIEKACHGVTIATDVPASDLVTNQIGETATLGDLRVTLEKVVTVPGVANPGFHFVFVSVTIENTGQTALITNSIQLATFKNAAGVQYGFEPNAIMLDASKPLDGSVAPGEKTSGTIGYELPVDAGDLIWVVEDNANNKAVFAVKASDIIVDGTPIGDATAAVMQTSVAATTAAMIDMANSMDATTAAMTANPEIPQSTETPIP